MKSLKDASHLYEVERREYHAARPGFRINELQISKRQKVPWHYHSNVQDTFYVVEGSIRIFRPHLVTNAGEGSATFLVLQGIGEYDFVPLLEKDAG